MKKRLLAVIMTALVAASVFAAAPVSAASSYKTIKTAKSGVSIDLLKGGKKEKLTYSFGANKSSITIRVNGIKKTLKVDDPEVGSFGKVFTGDINKKDKYTEIFIQETGENVMNYIVLRYNGKKLSRYKVLDYNFTNGSYSAAKQFWTYDFGSVITKVDGAGHVKTVRDSYAASGSFKYTVTFKLGGTTLKQAAQSFVKCDKNAFGTASASFYAYDDRSQSSTTFEVAKGATVYLVKTDMNGWVEIKTGGRTGWLYEVRNAGYYSNRDYPNTYLIRLNGIHQWG